MFNYDKLEQEIAKSGKTKTYLCQKLNRPAYYLRDVLKQKNIIPEDYQKILAEELGVTVEYLNDKENIKEKAAPVSEGDLSESESKLIEIWRSFTSEEQERLMKMLSALR